MKLYVARHGETTYNADGRYAGSTDVPLNEVGMEQARQLAESLVDLQLDVIVSSPKIRARRTAETVQAQLGIPLEFMGEFVERNMGAYEGLTREEAKARYPEVWKRIGTWPISPDDGPPEAETIRQCDERVKIGLDKIREKHSGKNVLLVCHGLISRVINRRLNGLSFEDMHSFTLGNCEVVEYTIHH